MADMRRFPLVNVERDGKPVQAMAIECRKCGVGARHIITTRANFSNALAAKYFRVHGWEIGKNARGDFCPDCIKRRKAKPEPQVVAMKDEAEAPREMSREDRRIIFAKIDELYLDDRTGYTPPWTDAAVARDLGVPRAWVAKVRDELFGPEGSNAEFDDFLEKVAPIIADLKNLARSTTAQLEEARKIGQRVDDIERLAKRIEREIGRA